MLSKKLIKLPLSSIDPDDELFRISYFRQYASLLESIKAVDLINPPLLQCKGDDKYRIVTGFLRIESLNKLKVQQTQAFKVSSKASNVDLFGLAILDNKSIREFNPVECSIIFNKLEKSFNQNRDVLICKYLPLLGLGANAAVLDRYLPIIKFDDSVKQWIADERLSIDVVNMLADMSQKDCNT